MRTSGEHLNGSRMSSYDDGDETRVQEETASPPTTRSGRFFARKLPAGIADAAFASLATFAAGLSAVTLFSDVDRGVYALFFSAFGLGVVLPWDLILIPAEVNAVSYDVVDRMRRAPDTLKMGLRASIVGSSAILVAAFFGASMTDTGVLVGLSVTAVIATILSPLQDHMRRLLHIAELSWRAAAVSMVQFVTVVVSLGVMYILDAPLAIMPFGSLAIANAASLTTGLILGDVMHQKPLAEPLRFWALASDGKWLLAQALIPSVAHFAVATIIAALAGPEILGYTEAARVVAQPVLVFATGLTAVLAPRAMRAAMDLDLIAARQARRMYLSLVMLAGAAYLVAASTDWIGNPMGYVVPAAYVVPWLVSAMVIGNMTTAALYLDTNELLGAKKARPMSIVSIVLSPILVLVALTAATTEAFARPLGKYLRNTIQFVWYRRMLGDHYRNDDAIVGAPEGPAEIPS